MATSLLAGSPVFLAAAQVLAYCDREPSLTPSASLGRSFLAGVSLPSANLSALNTRQHTALYRRDATVASASTVPAPSTDAKTLVQELLAKVDGSDRGAAMEQARKEDVFTLVEKLESMGMEEPLKSPLIFAEWDVVYSSSPTATGGGYRSAIGRTLLKTKEMCQTIAEPNVCKNLVSFDLLGVVPGDVSIQGTFNPEDNKWVRVDFEKPIVNVGPLKIRPGGTSFVRLSTTYLDEDIRIGRGSRGSVFIFKRRQ